MNIHILSEDVSFTNDYSDVPALMFEVLRRMAHRYEWVKLTISTNAHIARNIDMTDKLYISSQAYLRTYNAIWSDFYTVSNISLGINYGRWMYDCCHLD
jgi:hypothetical protein